jgi:maleylpyruvate isomerase
MDGVTAHHDLLDDATDRLLNTVDGLTDNQWSEPSLLPGWTRAHVVAHLTLNAEGLAGALNGVTHGKAVAMYTSQEARDGDIEELATRLPGEIRERFFAATTHFSRALGALPDDRLGVSINRTPAGPTFPAGAVAGMRLREVEIHHADLGVDYTRADWPTPFSEYVVDAMGKRVANAAPFSARATDTGGAWEFGGGGGPVVSGTAADLAWWLTGRGDGEGLTSDAGELPEVATW